MAKNEDKGRKEDMGLKSGKLKSREERPLPTLLTWLIC